MQILHAREDSVINRATAAQAGVDVALHLAKRLSNLRLEDATASVQKDKDMTLDLCG